MQCTVFVVVVSKPFPEKEYKNDYFEFMNSTRTKTKNKIEKEEKKKIRRKTTSWGLLLSTKSMIAF